MIYDNCPYLILGFSGTSDRDRDVIALKNFIDKNLVQGVILFDYNIESPQQLKKLISFLKDSKDDLIVSVDQEGGCVQRLRRKNGFTDYPSPQEVSENLTLRQAGSLYFQMAKELKSVGINYNFAPCVDFNPLHVPVSPIIGAIGRSFGTKENILAYTKEFVLAHQNNGVSSCLKHFPGHGSAQGDTHKGFVDISSVWREEEMEIFSKLIQEVKVESIMTGHLSHQKWGNKPATFSKRLIKTLREEYEFKGIIFSDDLHMRAILDRYSFSDTVVSAFASGINGFIFSLNPKSSGGQEILNLVDLVEEFWRVAKTA